MFEGATREDLRVLAPDERPVHLERVTWADYQRLLAIRGDSAVPRATFAEGSLELWRPSFDHERVASTLARLLEVFVEERGGEVIAAGSWTLEDLQLERGLEPDECYIVRRPGETSPLPERPDLAIEVAWTVPARRKLSIYAALGVGEVWLWERGQVRVFLLGADGYAEAGASALFPALDLARLGGYLGEPTMTAAVRAYRAWLRTAS